MTSFSLNWFFKKIIFLFFCSLVFNGVKSQIMNSNPCAASALWLSSPTRFVTCCCCCCCFCHCQCRQLLLTHSRYTSRFEALQAEQVRLQQHSCVHFTPFYFITLSSDAATTIVIASAATIATADSILPMSLYCCR